MSGLWRNMENNVYFKFPKYSIAGVYLIEGDWYLKFESGWLTGKFDTLEYAIDYALYHQFIQRV